MSEAGGPSGDAPSADSAGGGIRRRHSASHDEDELSPATRSAAESATSPYTIESPQRSDIGTDSAPLARTSAIEDFARPSISRLSSSDAAPRVRFSADIDRHDLGQRSGLARESVPIDETTHVKESAGSKKRPGTPDLTIETH